MSNYFTEVTTAYMVGPDDRAPLTPPDQPRWVFRLEGVLHEPSGVLTPAPRRRLSSFLRKALFEISVAGQPSEHVEWDRSFGASLDGFELLRPVPSGAPETTIRVMLWLDHLPQRWKLAPALSVLLGLHTDTKPRIVTQLWQYIKIHRLQDPDDKRVIHLNPQLKLLFPGTETIMFPDIGRLIEPHLLPPDPLELTYQVKLTGSPTGAEEVWEAIVDMEEGSPLSGQIRKELDQLDEQIVTISRFVGMSVCFSNAHVLAGS
jgi:SWI/SNF-related matrix-associated actin-dependent regulator of chromatin subfamily D